MSRNVVRTATNSKSVISNLELLVILELEPMSFALSNVIVFISSQLAKILVTGNCGNRLSSTYERP